MNKYELTVVVSAKLDDEGRTAEVEKVKALIEKFGGTITKIEEAGKKKLAYEIQKMSEAFYYFIDIDTENTDFPSELESQLRIMENVIRFMTVAVEAQFDTLERYHMNKVILMGRLTRDPEVRYSTSGDNQLAIARYTLAVDRRFKRDGDQSADFIRCVAFGRSGEFAEKYFHQGTKIVAEGRIQTGSYQDKDGKTVYTTEVVVENQEFAESKATADSNNNYQPQQQPVASQPTAPAGDGFMNIPDSVDDSGLPFNF